MNAQDLEMWLVSRMKEPSSYAGLAGLLTALHLVLPPGVIQVLPIIGMAIASVLAVLLPERSKAKIEALAVKVDANTTAVIDVAHAANVQDVVILPSAPK
jgi:hypothetical protein